MKKILFGFLLSAFASFSAAQIINAPNLKGPITSHGVNTAVASQTGTGSKFVMDTSPTLITPNIGNATGNISGNAATVTTNANLTGPITSVGNATSVASQTGTGSKFVMDTSPALISPTSNNFASGQILITSAGATTILTSGAARIQQLTGTLNQTFQLPDATTLALGWTFEFNNNSTGVLTITNSASTVIATIQSGGYARVSASSIGTSAGTWDVHFLVPRNAAWGSSGLAVTGTLSVAATPQSAATFYSSDAAGGYINIGRSAASLNIGSYAAASGGGVTINPDALFLRSANGIGFGSGGAAVTASLDTSGNFSVTGSTTIGTSLTNNNLLVNSIASGAHGGTQIIAQNGGTTVIAIGNKSAILALGTYDATPYLYGASAIGTNVGMDIGGNTTVTGTLSATGVFSSAGGSAGHATCWKADAKTIGYCSSQPDATGACTCN